ncbi:hypothetical protein [Algoriphagus limi]|uniref:Uncharacterized protein n=1 Tax=Algoriphagus limi TaxID=2975273 RepID=A0ABT2G7C2_9BACT|nr:hypothetical protein [Algoriphagus limi]MCS5491163.1 hypothetical protein [Algoriphagus limi]
MLGFKIVGCGLDLEVGADKIFLIFGLLKSSDREEISLDIRGSNNYSEQRINWGSWKLETEDEFRITVIEVKEVSNPVESKTEKDSEDQIKKEIETFLSLKKELETADLL